MANEQNLIPSTMGGHQLTEEEAKKGGIASGEARREKKSMQELARIILNMALEKGEVHSVEEMESIAETEKKNITVDQAILLKQVEKALKGDIQSAMFIRDTSGQKPVERTEVTEVPKIVDDV